MLNDPLKFCKTLDQEIVIAPNATIKVNDMIIFPHLYDGFHLWEAGIVLTRYIHYNYANKFEEKSVLELGTGVGITGIYITKYTRATQVLMTDYRDEILKNAERNALKNVKLSPTWQMLNLDWRNYKNYDYQFDFIVGADLIYTGSPQQELYQTAKKLLAKDGLFILLVPSQRDAIKDFLAIVEEDNYFNFECELLSKHEMYAPALKNHQESQKIYAGLDELKFFIYKFHKK